jgi:probable rRNA maturation factor
LQRKKTNFTSESAEKAAMVILRRTVAGLSHTALVRFVGRARRAARVRGDVHVLITTGGELASLNRRFRGQPQPTDVLSFPAPSHLPWSYAGDLAIAADLAAQNGRKMGHSAAEEVKILILHGVLHLAGYDHERDNGQMARKEERLRRQLRLPVGLIERNRRAAPRSRR